MQIYVLKNQEAVDSDPESTARQHGSTNFWSHHVKEVLLTASFLQQGVVSILMSATMQPVQNWGRGLSIPHDAPACCPRVRELLISLAQRLRSASGLGAHVVTGTSSHEGR